MSKHWVGRIDEVKQLETWLVDAEVNLIGIQGLGGIGKSALAAFLYENYPRLTSPPTPLLTGEGSQIQSQIQGQIQSDSQSHNHNHSQNQNQKQNQSQSHSQTPTPTLSPPFPGREAGALVRRLGGLGFSQKFWADISQKPDFSYFAEQVITAFGGKVTEPGDINLLIKDLLNCLNQQRYLLVIDNLETLLNCDRNWENSAYEQFFSHWVKHGKTSIILVTTQEKPVLFQPQTCWYLLQGMKTSEGAILLQQFGIQGSVSQLEAFAKQVDGHPLTLELVAGFLREYCDCQLNRAKELGLEKFEELVAEAKGLHRHKQDVRLSWILQEHFLRLSSTQASFLVDLSVYRQPFDFQTVRGMLNLDDQVKPLDIQKLLQELFNRSLLLKTQDGRYQYQALVQQYSQQKVTDLSVAHQKAIAYYLLHTKASPWQTLDDVTEYLEIFYHHCELQEYTQAFDTIHNDCDDFLSLRGYNNIRVELYGRLVQEWQPSNQDETWKFGASLTSLGNASYSLGEYQQAIDYHQQSLKIFQEIGARSGIAKSLNNLGNASHSLGEYQQAIDYHQQSLKIKQDIGDRPGIANSLISLGNASNSLGEYQQAIDYCQQSLKISQEIGARFGIAASLNNLANASDSLGKYQQAIDYHQQSLKISQEIGARSGIAKSLNNLGSASDSLGEYQQAIDYYQQSLKIFQDIGDRPGIAVSLMGLGNVSRSLGEYQQAIDYHQQSLKISQEIDNRPGIAVCLNNLGNASNSLGEYQQAIDYCQQSLTIEQEIGARSGIAKSLNNLGNASHSLGEYQQAIDYHQQSLKIKQDIGDRRGEANSWFNLANTLTKLNREQDAMGAYRNARALFQAMELDTDIQDCDNKIQEIETSLAKASHPTARNWLLTAFSFIWSRVQKFWGFVRNHFNS